jgi:Ribbon-helix-helix protein, copG family.
MSKKMGRPKADNPKDIKFSIRLDEETNKQLDEYSEKHHIRKAEAIRKAIFQLLGKK